MGYYISVEPHVKIYVEDLNPSGSKTILFVHGWPGNIICLNTSLTICRSWETGCVGVDCRAFASPTGPGADTITTAGR
jgi:non-heme chloroperoxidase